MSAASKRTFLHRAFHPIGQHACALMGMLNASEDVERAEFVAAQAALEAVPDRVIERALERSKWIIEVLSSPEWTGLLDCASEVGDEVMRCPDCGEPCQAITLQEILVKFYLAMRLEENDACLR